MQETVKAAALATSRQASAGGQTLMHDTVNPIVAVQVVPWGDLSGKETTLLKLHSQSSTA
jgi:hypothetical protein